MHNTFLDVMELHPVSIAIGKTIPRNRATLSRKKKGLEAGCQGHARSCTSHLQTSSPTTNACTGEQRPRLLALATLLMPTGRSLFQRGEGSLGFLVYKTALKITTSTS